MLARVRPHSSTVAKVRLLQALGLHRPHRRQRIPHQAQPDLIRMEYFHALMPLIRHQTAHLKQAAHECLVLLVRERAAQGKVDADYGAEAKAVVARAGRAAAEAFRPRELHAVATQFGERTGRFQQAQLDKQVRAAIGVPLSAVEKPITDLVPVFAKANTELVKTVAPRYHDRLAKDVEEAFESGMHPETLAARFVDLDDMVESDAMRLARDQIGKLSAQFNQERQESMGVTSYVWRTLNDQRVRDNHADLDGETFDWADPPLGGGTDEDEEGHPGDGIQCRCYAEPDFSDILENLGDEDET